MKPNFALDFRHDAISLLHRTSRGWQMVGQVALDAPDLAEALSYLRSTALGLSPKGLTTKLIIPNSQILYTQVRAPAPDMTRRRKQVARALEGMTPYPVAELAYDFWGNGPDLQVAVIARETLAEAEAFATAHRFNPVSFVAVPDTAAFQGEPWFGATQLSVSLLAEGEKVDRDQDPVVILSRDLGAREAALQAPEPAREQPPAPTPVKAEQIDPPLAAPPPPAPDVAAPPVSQPVEPVAVTLPPLSTSIPLSLVLFTAAPVPEIEIAPVAVVTKALSTRTPALLKPAPPVDAAPLSVRAPAPSFTKLCVPASTALTVPLCATNAVPVEIKVPF